MNLGRIGIAVIIGAAWSLSGLLPAGNGSARACTAFVLEKEHRVVLAKSFDWHSGAGLVVVNRRGLAKKALIVGGPDQELAAWKARYGSLTSCWAGLGLPTGGLNEQGLAVTGLLFKQALYPPLDSRAAIGPSQWKQMVLDTCATVDQALATLKEIRLFTASRFGEQFILADPTGNRALVQFRDGKPFIHTGNDLPYPVTANDLPYPTALKRAKQTKGFGSPNPVLTDQSNLNRFILAASSLRNPDGTDPVTRARQILEAVWVGRTRWQITHDLREKVMTFNTWEDRRLRRIDLKKIDFACPAPLRLMPIPTSHQGDVTDRFQAFDPRAYDEFLAQLRAGTAGFSDRVVEALRAYALGLNQCPD